jgi:hypothetical protein
VQAVAGSRQVERTKGEPGRLLVPIGVALTLVGVVGDLLVRALAPAAHANDPLLALRLSGTGPWHIVLFAGIVVTTLGAIRWATRLESEFGHLLGAVMSLLLVTATVLGVWSMWQARNEPATTSDAGARSAAAIAAAGPGGVSTDLGHAPAGSVDGIADGVTGAEGQSFTGHVHGTPGAVTPAEAKILAQQLAAAKRATARYRDIAKAKADGYIQVTQFIPGLGLHMANLGISNKVFDPAKPQVLLYQPRANGSLQLVGVAYSIAHTGPNDEQPAGFAGNSDAWHFHRNLCFLPGGTVTITPTRADCRSRRGYFQAKTAWLLHAWIWKTNPDGVFTESNPRVF